MDSILEQAEKVVQIERPIDHIDTKIDTEVLETIDFTTPEDVLYMADYFSIDTEGLLDTVTSDKLRFIYNESTNSSLSLYDFIQQSGLRVGGRHIEGFLDKVYVHLNLLSEEYSAETKAAIARAERQLYEKNTIIQKEYYRCQV